MGDSILNSNGLDHLSCMTLRYFSINHILRNMNRYYFDSFKGRSCFCAIVAILIAILIKRPVLIMDELFNIDITSGSNPTTVWKNGALKFNPTLYLQRYMAVYQTVDHPVWAHHMEKAN